MRVTFGIDDNTPERFMTNARLAGVAGRAQARIGDMRDMPFENAAFDAAISSYAIDHLGQDGSVKAVAEVARVLKPRVAALLRSFSLASLVAIACQVLIAVVNVSLLPKGSFTDISRVPHGISSMPGRAYL
jgi:SAM-dependent methyltransferase